MEREFLTRVKRKNLRSGGRNHGRKKEKENRTRFYRKRLYARLEKEGGVLYGLYYQTA
jgi:hypothetical protein